MIDRRFVAALAFGLLAAASAVKPVDAQQTPVRVARSVLETYVGEYVYPEGNTLQISLSGDTLFRVDGSRRLVLVPVSETLFRLGPGLTMEFVTAENRETTIVLGNGANMEFRLPRKGTRPVLPPTPKAVPVPRSVLQRYVGDYEYIRGQMNRTDLRVYIRLRGDVLTQALDNNKEQVLIPLSQTRFNVSGTSLVTEFVVDDAGVTQVMGSGGREMIARLMPKH